MRARASRSDALSKRYFGGIELTCHSFQSVDPLVVFSVSLQLAVECEIRTIQLEGAMYCARATRSSVLSGQVCRSYDTYLAHRSFGELATIKLRSEIVSDPHVVVEPPAEVRIADICDSPVWVQTVPKLSLAPRPLFGVSCDCSSQGVLAATGRVRWNLAAVGG